MSSKLAARAVRLAARKYHVGLESSNIKTGITRRIAGCLIETTKHQTIPKLRKNLNLSLCLEKEEKQLLQEEMPPKGSSHDPARPASSSLSVVSTECSERETTLSVSVLALLVGSEFTFVLQNKADFVSLFSLPRCCTRVPGC